MVFPTCVWLLFCVFAIINAAKVAPPEDAVIELTDENFRDQVTSHDILLVEFYAPWCRVCMDLAPEYAKAASVLKERDPPIHLAKIDATTHVKSSSAYEIRGYPTIYLFRGSTELSLATAYYHNRSAESIVQWMIAKAGPAVSMVEDLDSLNAMIEANEVIVLAILESVDCDEKTTLERVAIDDENAVYAATTNTEIATHYGVAAPAVILFKSFDEGRADYDGAFTKEDIADFVVENSIPLLSVYSEQNARKIFSGPIKAFTFLFADPSKDYYQELSSVVKVAAKRQKGKLLHIVIPPGEDQILEYFSLEESDLPIIMLVDMEKGMKKFMFESKSDGLIASIATNFEAELLNFQESYFRGELTPLLKSGEPVDDSDAIVKVVVGKEFEDRVLKSEEDVLVKFYADWCSHCKALAPKYEALAERLSGVESIIIAKMDAIANEIDVEGVDVSGFPTLILFRAGMKESPLVYDGAHAADDIYAWLNSNAGTKFSLDDEFSGTPHEEL